MNSAVFFVELWSCKPNQLNERENNTRIEFIFTVKVNKFQSFLTINEKIPNLFRFEIGRART